jgi:ABC-2 type transport system permease protein
MRLYWQIMLNAIQSTTTYRFHTFISTLSRIVSVFVQISLWTALYKGAEALHISIKQATLHDMWLYTIMGTLISLLVSNTNVYSISDKIQTGNIEINIIRPIGLFRTLLFETIGSKVTVLLMEITPILVLGLWVFSISISFDWTLLWFFITLLNGFMVFFLLTYLAGLCSFWYIRIFHLEFMLNHIINFFSGMMIPLWFFPNALLAITSYLPFKLIYYSPLSIVLGKTNGTEIGQTLLQGYAWIILLAGAVVFVWHKGKKKLIIQGG